MDKEVVILLNMGGPNDLSEVKVFLKNMFNDKAKATRHLVANRLL